MTETKIAGPNDETQVFDCIEILEACGLPVKDSDLIRTISREYDLIQSIEGIRSGFGYAVRKQELKNQGVFLIDIQNKEHVLDLQKKLMQEYLRKQERD